MPDDKWAGVPSVEDSWINTVSGKRFDILNPKEDQIDISDIAKSLSHINRYSGQTKFFYSVAEHSFLVSHVVDQDGILPLMGLLHDSAEAYLGDVTSPLKALLPRYRDIENKVLSVILSKFNLPNELPSEVIDADRRILATEAQSLFDTNEEWKIPFEVYEDVPIRGWSPGIAELAFMDRLQHLTMGRE